MAVGQAPLGWVAIALPSLVLYIQLVARAPTRPARIWAAYAGGVGYFAATLSWIVQPFLIDLARHGWMAPFALILIALGMALFWGAAGWLAGLSRHTALMFAVALAGSELARGHVLTGFPWALIGHIWTETPLIQLAALIGPNGMTLVTTLTAGAVVAILGASGSLRIPAAALLIVAVGGAATLYASARLGLPEPEPRRISLRLIQPAVSQALKWDAAQADIVFQRQIGFTATQPVADLTIWPETSVPYAMGEGSPAAMAIAAASGGRTVIVGMQRAEGAQFWNTLGVIGAGGAILASYDKWHLVPFGEYIPYGDRLYRWFGISAFAARAGAGYSAGPGPVLLDLGRLGRMIPLICYEAVFPAHLRQVQGRGDWILQITNDAWFGTLTGPWQHFAQARLRAVEQGLPLIRVANTGITAVVDARGRIVQADGRAMILPFGEPGYLDVPHLPGPLAPPPYARFGEAPVLVWLAGLAGMLLWTGRRRRH